MQFSSALRLGVLSMSLVVSATVLATCNRSDGSKGIQAPTESKSAAPSPPTVDMRLGDGYRNVRWGLSQAEVKEALGETVVADWNEIGYLGLMTEKADSIDCEFSEEFKNGLARVVFLPMDIDENGDFHALRALMEEKFGDSEEVRNERPEHCGGIYQMYKWEDDTTSIVLRRVEPPLVDDSRSCFEEARTTIEYRSKAAELAEKQAEGDRRKVDRQRRLEEARRQMGDKL